MNKTKIRLTTIFALLAALALAMSFAFGSLFTKKGALAADYRPSEIFSAGTGGSVGVSGEEGDAERFVEFTFSEEDGSVYFRRDLALKWLSPVEAEETPEEDEPAEQAEESGGEEGAQPAAAYETNYFSMTFAFPSFDFSRFTLEFESAEENISKEGTAVNSLVFFYEEDKLSAAVRDSYAQPDEDTEEEDDAWFEDAEKVALDIAAGADITVSFEEAEVGSFHVLVNGTEVGTFTNVGGYYMEYLSSASSTPRDPIAFRADELKEGKSEQKLVMKDLNGQSFKLNENSRIDDTADPVLVINEEIYAYTLGRKWSLTYEAIDVCDSSVTITRRYAMVNAADDEGNYPKPTKDDYSTLSTSTVFMPTSDTQSEEQYVSIYFELDDGTNLSGLGDEEKEAKRVYLWWYAAEGQTKSLSDGTEEFTYILVNRGDVGDVQSGEKSGPYYVGVTPNHDELNNKGGDAALAKELAEKYQAAIDEVVYETVEKDGASVKKCKLSAGDGAYFYLPSLRGLIASKNADYRNLRFSIYYKKQSLETTASASSATSLRYNALRFEIDEEGKYVFKVLASDAAGNAMKYYVDGEYVTVSSDNIWDIEEIPTFSLEASYTGATIKNPGTQSLGYCASSYSISSFDIVALDGYKTSYKLYRYDATKEKENQQMPAYSDFVENVKTYVNEYSNCLVEIKKYNSSITEDDVLWDSTDNKYHWDPDNSLSFVPQERTIYVVQLDVTEENRLPGSKVTAYQVIEAQNPLDPRPNNTEWLESNVTAIVLFSVSAVLLIVIIVLFVVKPSEKSIEEVDVSTLRGRKAKKAAKSEKTEPLETDDPKE